MVSDHPAKFGGHRHWSSGDINIPANTVILPRIWDVASVTYASTIITRSKVHGKSCSHTQNFRLIERL